VIFFHEILKMVHGFYFFRVWVNRVEVAQYHCE